MSKGLGRQQAVARAQAYAAALGLAGLALRFLARRGPGFTRPWCVASSPEELAAWTRERNDIARQHLADVRLCLLSRSSARFVRALTGLKRSVSTMDRPEYAIQERRPQPAVVETPTGWSLCIGRKAGRNRVDWLVSVRG